MHERSVDGDFLLLELKELLKRNSNLKIVLMSATINHETFIRYFSNAPLLTIPGFTHPVKDMCDLDSGHKERTLITDDRYLEDFINLIDYRPLASKGRKKQDDEDLVADRDEYVSAGLDESAMTAIQAINQADRIDYAVSPCFDVRIYGLTHREQLIAAAINYIMSTAEAHGGILVFLPGVQEIRQCIDTLQSSPSASQAKIFPLHANLSSDEQRAVFAPTAKWKIVVATNVAEVSFERRSLHEYFLPDQLSHRRP